MNLCAPHDDIRTIPVHHSWLKRMALSPSHALYAATHKGEQTRPMRIGTLVHRMVLGGPWHRWDGDRRAKGYPAFEASCNGELVVTTAEYDAGAPVAEAVLASSAAGPWLRGQREVPLAWQVGGRRCATDGIDVCGEGFIADLKTTDIAAPNRFTWQARRMGYISQLPWYDDALEALGHRNATRDLVLIAAEAHPPYPVVVFRLSQRAIEAGRRMNALWLERLRVCEATNEWPGYVQDVVELDVEETGELEFDAD